MESETFISIAYLQSAFFGALTTHIHLDVKWTCKTTWLITRLTEKKGKKLVCRICRQFTAFLSVAHVWASFVPWLLIVRFVYAWKWSQRNAVLYVCIILLDSIHVQPLRSDQIYLAILSDLCKSDLLLYNTCFFVQHCECSKIRYHKPDPCRSTYTRMATESIEYKHL